MNKRVTLLAGMIILMLAVYSVGYIASVRPSTAYSVIFTTTLPPDYRVPSSTQAAAHWVFNPAYLVDSHVLRPAKWDALRPPPVLQPAGTQNR